MKIILALAAIITLTACTHCPPGHMKNGKCMGKKPGHGRDHRR